MGWFLDIFRSPEHLSHWETNPSLLIATSAAFTQDYLVARLAAEELWQRPFFGFFLESGKKQDLVPQGKRPQRKKVM